MVAVPLHSWFRDDRRLHNWLRTPTPLLIFQKIIAIAPWTRLLQKIGCDDSKYTSGSLHNRETGISKEIVI